MNRTSKIYVAGSNGLVGSAVVRLLKSRGFENILTTSRCGVSPIDLRNPEQVRWWFSCYEPDYVINAAARVGGIKDNIKHPLAFFEDNIAIQQNIFRESHRYGVRKLLFLGSNCIYPRECHIPIPETALLTGRLESTNEPYALAKIAGVKLCQWYRKEHGCNFVSAMPCNLYGPGDRFSAEDGHLVPSMMTRMHHAKLSGDTLFKVWGDGTALRELLYSDDLARALLTVMAIYNEPEPINVGGAHEYSIRDIATSIAFTVDYRGMLQFDKSQPIGTFRKLLNHEKIFQLGWRPETNLAEGLRLTYQNFLDNPETRRGTR
jgi:GDP-L-fucose synthase